MEILFKIEKLNKINKLINKEVTDILENNFPYSDPSSRIGKYLKIESYS